MHHQKNIFCVAKVKKRAKMSVTKFQEIVQVNAIINSCDCDDVTIENENVTKSDNNANNVNSSSKHPHSVQSIQTINALPNIIVTEIDEIDSNLSNERRQSITSSSIDSNRVSIKSIDENNDSINSLDTDPDSENVIDNRTDIYATSIGLVPPNRIIDPNNISNSNILCAKDATERPNISSIAMQNCNDVTFGDKTYISGNVIVKQFIQTDDQNTWKERGGVDNSAYAGSANHFDQNQNGNSPSNVRFYDFFSSILCSMITIS